jgi:hypothetical protein
VEGEGIGWSAAALRRLRVTDGGVDLRRIGPGQLVREKRRGERKARVPKGGGGVTWSRRISTETVAATADSDEKSGRPGGAIWRGEKGEMEKGSRAIYRYGERPNYSGSNGELNGRVIGGEDVVSGVKFGLRKKKAGLTGGVRLSARGEEKDCTGSGEEVSGPRVSFHLWAEGFPRPFSIFISSFSFSFSAFLFLS